MKFLYNMFEIDYRKASEFNPLILLAFSLISLIFAMQLDSGAITTLVDGIEEPWTFRQYTLHSEYKLAVCASHSLSEVNH
jgi:hypothetical protein